MLGVGVQVLFESECGVLNFLALESESSTPHPCFSASVKTDMCILCRPFLCDCKGQDDQEDCVEDGMHGV